jgi:hypothetical protein
VGAALVGGIFGAIHHPENRWRGFGVGAISGGVGGAIAVLGAATGGTGGIVLGGAIGNATSGAISNYFDDKPTTGGQVVVNLFVGGATAYVGGAVADNVTLAPTNQFRIIYPAASPNMYLQNLSRLITPRAISTESGGLLGGNVFRTTSNQLTSNTAGSTAGEGVTLGIGRIHNLQGGGTNPVIYQGPGSSQADQAFLALEILSHIGALHFGVIAVVTIHIGR